MITLTLSEILSKLGCPRWDEWCEVSGWNPWCVAEGGGDIKVTIIIDEAIYWGMIGKEKYWGLI